MIGKNRESFTTTLDKKKKKDLLKTAIDLDTKVSILIEAMYENFKLLNQKQQIEIVNNYIEKIKK